MIAKLIKVSKQMKQTVLAAFRQEVNIQQNKYFEYKYQISSIQMLKYKEAIPRSNV